MIRISKFAATFAFLGVAALAAADSDTPTTPPPPAAPAPGRALTVVEMRASLEKQQSQMAADQREILHLREVAKKNKDVIKLNCINDKLVELKAQQNVADGYAQQLTASLDANSDERFAAYASFDSTSAQIKNLTEQAKACIGEPELYKQESGVEVERPEIPDDPTVNPFGTGVDIEPPAYASPFD